MTHLFRPSELFPYLQEIGTSAKKSLSQNYLIDGNILEKIVTTAELAKGDFILEIGPGPGALTQALLKKGASVLAVEKDALFAKGLTKLQAEYSTLEVLEGDFLDLDLEKILKARKKPCKVVANLPYQITTPILAKLFPLIDHVSTITVMVQKEVGQRMVAREGSKDYSRLSLFTHYFCAPKLCFTVSPNSFYPPPKVSSCVMHLKLHTPPHVSSEKQFFETVKAAFSQKRKMLRASLKELYPKQHIEEALRALSLPHTSRPQQLSLEQFIALFENLSSRGSGQH